MCHTMCHTTCHTMCHTMCEVQLNNGRRTKKIIGGAKKVKYGSKQELGKGPKGVRNFRQQGGAQEQRYATECVTQGVTQGVKRGVKCHVFV